MDTFDKCMEHMCEGIPSIYFRVKSHCNRWLSVVSERVVFVERQQDSCGIGLVPHKNGMYMLHVIWNSNVGPHLVASNLAGQATHATANTPNVCTAEGHTNAFDSNPWFLCKQGQLICVSQNSAGCLEEDFHFQIDLEETQSVRICCGLNKGYLSLDSSGQLLVGTQKGGKSKTFELIEFATRIHCTVRRPWISQAPVRVHFKAHTGKFLCSGASVLSALAETSCCCEEFLMDISFPPMPPFLEPVDQHASCGELHCSETQPLNGSGNGGFRIRTADGLSNWSVGADGKLSTVHVHKAQGRENFVVYLCKLKNRSIVNIACYSMQNVGPSCYASVDPFGKVACSKLWAGAHEEFNLELANGSCILIRSVHGGFLGSEEAPHATRTLLRHSQRNRIEESILRKVCSCVNVSDISKICAWRLRAHGDSLYTLVAATTSRVGGDVYLFVDSRGKIMQSSDPGVHFPATASLFEIKPSTSLHVNGESPGSIVGFTIRTVRKVNGKQRYLSSEPNGVLRAMRTSFSRWEIFQLVDVDASAANASPSDFCCLPAAVNLHASSVMLHPLQTGNTHAPASRISGRQSWSRNASRDDDLLTTHGFTISHKKYLSIAGMSQSVEYLQRAARVAAAAIREGLCVPKKVPTTLEDMCIQQACLQVSTGPLSLSSEFGGSLFCTLTANHFAESYMGIPDELYHVIMVKLRSRQHPEMPCKSLPDIITPQNGLPYIRDGSQSIAERTLENNPDGLICHSCNYSGILKMDPTVNPAHHRYLEVQYRMQHGVTQQTGFLWNLISFAGVGIMSTALLLQLFATRKNRQKRRTTSR